MAILQLVFSGALSIISCVGAQERQVCIKNHDLIAQDSDWAQLKPKAKLVRSGMSSDRKPRWSRKRQNERKVSEQQGYRKVSSLVNLPGFLPGIGALYVKPGTLPAGPFRAFDRHDRLVSTIYMIPTEDFQNKKAFDLKGAAGKADHITIYFNAGHPGVEVPHYHIVVWHVSKKEEARVAR
ncbi:hypothetical protein M446_1320 [Methylobacterium sp. 4-46]|uniref:DUF5602 domain-containing protein n=1 Tax=unclassified Methylobacterium TaxID=2615210 RepID=UPI000165C58A|nr:MULTISPECIES: hypothetical protein [Methylobacterium]ACA15837.1 hypothetical protein M446_1320 [Methylobacterium sp. 4-46]WFT81565.1 hypothetical protein QA634_06695 [Methylobacterium nodulans]